MKKIIIIALILLAFFGACENNLLAPDFFNNNETGIVHISIGTDDARTILPSKYDLTALYYKLVFTAENNSNNKLIEYLNGETSGNFYIPAGRYNLNVFGYLNEAIASEDSEHDGTGALLAGLAGPFSLSTAGNISVNVVLTPNADILTQTPGNNGTLRYEIKLPVGASGTLTVNDSDTINLSDGENADNIILASGDYPIVIVVEYDNKVIVKREIAQIYDNATSIIKYEFETNDFLIAKEIAITNVVIDGKHGDIELEEVNGNEFNVTVFIHPEYKDNDYSFIIPNISYHGAMITPTGPQDFSNNKMVTYTITSVSGNTAVFNLSIAIATVNFDTMPVLSIDPGNGVAFYNITRPSPDDADLILYYAMGDFSNVEEIKAANGSVSKPILTDADLNAEITGLVNEELYSFIVEAVKEHYNNGYSFIEKGTPSNKPQLTPSDFNWNGAAVQYNGSPQPVSVNSLHDEVNQAGVTVRYISTNPVYNSTNPPTNAGIYEIRVSVPVTENFARASNLLLGLYEIKPIPFDTAPVLTSGNVYVTSYSNASVLTYSFSPSEPAADYYTVYYNVSSSTRNEAWLLNSANAASVTKERLNAGELTGTISGLANSTRCSLLIVAEKENYITNNSAVVASQVFGTYLDLSATTVANNPNQIQYSRTSGATSGPTYTVFYISEDTDDINRIVSVGTSLGSASSGTVSNLNYNSTYSFVIRGIYSGRFTTYTPIRKITTGNNSFTAPPTLTSVAPLQDYGLRFDPIGHSTPTADTYTVYYIPVDTNDTEYIIANGNSVVTTPSAGDAERTLTGLVENEMYSFVVVADRADFPRAVSTVVKSRTESEVVYAYIDEIEEIGFDTKVKWSIKNGRGQNPSLPVSNILLSYNYSGLEIEGGKLTANVISGTKTVTLTSNTGEYIINHGGLISVTDIVVSATVSGQLIESEPHNTSPIELRLYNIAYEKAKEYGAIEMFSYAKAATSLPTVYARGHTIVNYNKTTKQPINIYGAANSKGIGGMGSGAATQLREWYSDGQYLYGRTAGGSGLFSEGSDWVSGDDENAPCLPASTSSRNWPATTSVDSSHNDSWFNFQNSFIQNPYGYIPYDVNKAYIGPYEYMYTNPTTINNNANLQGGRSPSLAGITGLDATPGKLAINSEEHFQFTIEMSGNDTGNGVNIEWSGNVTLTGSEVTNAYITFVIDKDFKFVKYHAFERYAVSSIVGTQQTNTAAAMYFIYHDNNIDFSNHVTYRAHQDRANHKNYCDCTNCKVVIAPNGNTATGNMVVAGSEYAINLNWIFNENTTIVSIP